MNIGGSEAHIDIYDNRMEISFLENLLPWSGKLPAEIRKA